MMTKLRPREDTIYAKGHTPGRWQNLGLNPGRGLAADPAFKNYASQPQGKIPLIKQNLK